MCEAEIDNFRNIQKEDTRRDSDLRKKIREKWAKQRWRNRDAKDKQTRGEREDTKNQTEGDICKAGGPEKYRHVKQRVRKREKVEKKPETNRYKKRVTSTRT